jgi:hypothetical protein
MKVMTLQAWRVDDSLLRVAGTTTTTIRSTTTLDPTYSTCRNAPIAIPNPYNQYVMIYGRGGLSRCEIYVDGGRQQPFASHDEKRQH